MVNADNEAVYCKFHYKTDQGIKCFDRHQADEMAKQDPDYAIRDLFNSIANGNFPTWTMHIQVMTFEQAEAWEFNPFDLTKVRGGGWQVTVPRSGPTLTTRSSLWENSPLTGTQGTTLLRCPLFTN